MTLLLDTHVFLWLISGQNLSQTAKAAYLDPDNKLYLSAASYWEICIKVSLGKLSLTPNWIKRFDEQMAENGIQWLPVEKEDCQNLILLPHLHKDPFDRLLIAQSLNHDLTLLTADSNIHQYNVSTLW